MKSRNILIYYNSLRSYILFQKILREKPGLFDYVIKMPAIPYSRKTSKRNYLRLIKVFLESPNYVIMQFLTIYVYSL